MHKHKVNYKKDIVMLGFFKKKKNEIKDQYEYAITGYYEGEFILQIEYEETN